MGECSCPPKKWNKHNKKGKDMSKLNVKDFIAGIGHYCKMKDGSQGYIAKKTAHHGSVLPRVLHNYTGAPRSWE